MLPGPIILCSPPHLVSYATVLFKMIFQLGRRCTKHQRRRCYHHSIHWSQSTVNAAVVVTAFCWRCTLASSQCTVHCSSFGLLQLCSLHCTFHSAWIQQKSELRRRTSQGAGEGCSPPDSGKPIIFGQKLIFWADTSSKKWKKKLYLLMEKKEFILFSEIKCPKSGIFTNNYWVGWVGQSNFCKLA